MHELAVTESILSIANKHAIQAGAEKVTDIYLVLGQLSSIIDDSIQFYWDIISQETICEKARIHIKRIPAKVKCLDCDHEYGIKDLIACPECNSQKIKIISGDEFYLESIEITKDLKEQT